MVDRAATGSMEPDSTGFDRTVFDRTVFDRRARNTELVDARRYRRTAALGLIVPLVIFTVGSALQSFLFQVARGVTVNDEIYGVPLWARVIANLSVSVIFTLGVWLVPIRPQRRVLWSSAVVGMACVAVLVRAGLQITFKVYLISQVHIVIVDVVVGLVCALFSVLVGVLLAEAFAHARAQERATARQALRARAALDALQTEELRVRREVAEGLHGTVQQRLVLLGVRLRGAIDQLPVAGVVSQDSRAQLEEIEHDIDELRETGVREMSHLLYPEGVDLGLAPAIRMMLRRVPHIIGVQVEIDPAVTEYDDPAHGRIPQGVRLLAVRVLEEAVSNALRHGHAGHIAVTVGLRDDNQLSLVVEDDGVGVPEVVVLSGLDRLHERVKELGGTLLLARGELGGAQLAVTIPLH